MRGISCGCHLCHDGGDSRYSGFYTFFGELGGLGQLAACFLTIGKMGKEMAQESVRMDSQPEIRRNIFP